MNSTMNKRKSTNIFELLKRKNDDEGFIKPRGMLNPDKTSCYMNSVLQILLNLKPFRQDLVSKYSAEITSSRNGRTEYPLMSSLISIMSQMNNNNNNHNSNSINNSTNYYYNNNDNNNNNKHKSEPKTIDPTPVKKAIAHKYTRFSGKGQQDAHDFLSSLIDLLAEETTSFLFKKSILFEEKGQEYQRSAMCPVTRNLQGEMVKTYSCLFCSHTCRPSIIESFSSLVLPISSFLEEQTTTINDLIQMYFQDLELPIKCGKCKKTGVIVKTEITRMPSVLILTVDRSISSPAIISYRHSISSSSPSSASSSSFSSFLPSSTSSSSIPSLISPPSRHSRSLSSSYCNAFSKNSDRKKTQVFSDRYIDIDQYAHKELCKFSADGAANIDDDTSSIISGMSIDSIDSDCLSCDEEKPNTTKGRYKLQGVITHTGAGKSNNNKNNSSTSNGHHVAYLATPPPSSSSSIADLLTTINAPLSMSSSLPPWPSSSNALSSSSCVVVDEEDKWLKYDDKKVKRVDANKAMSLFQSQGCIYFYTLL